MTVAELKREIIPIESEDQWLGLRVNDLTSTDIAALFGCSPYTTALELWHRKRNGERGEFEANERIKWGNRLEAAIAAGVAEEQGWVVEPMNLYARLPEHRLGSSFDFQIIGEHGGNGLLEIKNVDGLVFKREWLVDEDGNVEAPPHIEFQLQHEMLVAGREWGAIGALVAGNRLVVIRRSADPEIQNAILSKAASFWASIDADQPPEADYERDAEVLIRMHSKAFEGEILDASGDAEIESSVREYHRLGEEIKDLESKRKAIRARVLERIGTASKVIGPWGSITASEVRDKPPTVITADMIGQEIGGRKGYRNFRVSLKG